MYFYDAVTSARGRYMMNIDLFVDVASVNLWALRWCSRMAWALRPIGNREI